MSNNNIEIPMIRTSLRNRNVYFILIFLLAVVLLFSNLWIGDLGLDSSAYATISRSILRTNDWIVPHYEHCKEYSDCWLHPPLFYWMTATSFKIFGVNEFAAKFISALLGVFTILLVYLIGYRVSNSYKIGFFSAFVLLTTQPFLDLGRKCQLDVPLTFFITLSILFLILAIQKNEKFFILLGISTGFAILTKGLPAISILGIVFLFFILNKDFKFFLSLKFYLFVLFIILTLCIWVIPLIQVGEYKNFLNNYFASQIWRNIAGVEALNSGSFFEKAQGYLWYIVVLAKKYWPWFPFLVLSFYFGFKRLKENKMLLIFMLWIFIVLLGFSLGETKFYRYLAPVYPGSAILIGVTFGEKISEKLFKGILNFSLALLFILLLTTSIFPIYFGKISGPDKTEIKKISPYIKSLTKRAEHISVYKMDYWGAVAEFAFYVDRPIKKYDTEDAFALSLKKDSTFGYLTKDEYNNSSTEFKKNHMPFAKTENFFLITNIQNYEVLTKKIFPIFIY